MSNIDQIVAAARKRGRTKEIDLGDGMKITVRELTPAEEKAMEAKIWITGDDGHPTIFDKPKGNPDAKPVTTGEGYRHPRDGVNYRREYLLATMEPKEAVDGLLSDEVPESVKAEIFDAAQAVNGIEPAAVIAKN